MVDLNMMLRDTARSGLQTQLDTAVTNGDTEAARKAADDLSKLDAATAPKAPAYSDVEIRAELNKQPWFGTDPKKSGAAMRLGKDMDPKKFASAEAFATALVKAVEDEFKPAGGKTAAGETEEEETGEEEEAGEEETAGAPAKPKPKRTDGPNDADTGGTGTRRASGPWTKLSDAPPAVQKEIKRTADKFAPKTEDGQKKYIAKALEAQYAQHQRAKGKR